MEDVPTGLVPMASLGDYLGINTPTIDSIIHLSSIICCVDFKNKGRTVKNLNLEGYIKERLYQMKYLSKELFFDKKIRITKSEDT